MLSFRTKVHWPCALAVKNPLRETLFPGRFLSRPSFEMTGGFYSLTITFSQRNSHLTTNRKLKTNHENDKTKINTS